MLAALLAADDAERTRAEQLYRAALADRPFHTLGLLADALADPKVPQGKMASVLLRRALEEGAAWEALSPEQAFDVGSRVLAAVQSEQRDTRRAAMAPLAQLSKLILEKSGQAWPQLFRAVFDLAVSPSSDKREAGFECFETIAEYSPKAVAPHASTIGEVLSRGMQDPDSVAVRLASIRAMSSLLVSLDSDVQLFAPAIPLMLTALRGALDQASSTSSADLETASQQALTALIEVAESHPKLIKPHLYDTATSMLAIVGATQLDPHTRALGLEFLITLSESSPGFVRAQADLAVLLVPLAVRLMIEATDPSPNMEEWGNDLQIEADDEVDAEENDLYAVGEEAVSRLSTALGGKTVIPSLFQSVPDLLSSPEWPRRRACLMALAAMAEGAGKRMYAKLDQVMRWVLPFFADPHPKVRYAAVHLIGRLALDFEENEEERPSFQKLFASRAIPALASALMAAPQQPWKVRVHAAAAMVNFFTEQANLEPSDVAPYCENVLRQLVQLLLDGPMAAKQEALVAMAGLAVVAGPGEFAAYYDFVMPVILATVLLPTETHDEHESMFRGRAVECLGLMAAAAGPAKFAKDAARTMEIILSGIRQDGDETVRRYAFVAASRVAGVLQNDFASFLPELMPRLLHGAKAHVTVALFNDDPETIRLAREQGLEVTQLSVRGTGTRMLGVNTQALQDVVTCIYAVFNLADELEGLLAPYAVEALDTIGALLDFQFSSSVRNVSIITLPRLVKCLAADAALASDRMGSVVRLFCNRIIQLSDSEEGDEEDDLESVMHMTEALVLMSRWSYESGGATDNDPYLQRRANADCPPRILLPSTALAETSASLAVLLNNRTETLVLFRSEMAIVSDDADAIEALQAKDDKLREALVHVIDTIGYLIIKPFGQTALALFHAHFMPLIKSMTMHTAPADLQTQAICMLDDMVEFAGGVDPELERTAFELYVHGAQHEDPHLARACVWGMGLLAHRGGSFLDAPKVAQAADLLMGAVVHWRGRVQSTRQRGNGGGEEEGEEDEDNAWMSNVVADNALSSLDKLARYRARADLIPWILSRVPLLADAEEAKVVNVQLENYVSAGVLAPERLLLIVADQLSHGWDAAAGRWDEEDAFVCAKQRSDLAARLARGTLALPANADANQRAVLQALATLGGAAASS